MHFRHPTDEQLGHVDIFFSNYHNLWSVLWKDVINHHICSDNQKNCHGSPRKWKSNFTQFPFYMWNVEILPVYYHNSCEIWHLFSQTSMRNFLWCYYRWFITSLALENVKKNAIFFKTFWYKIFVHWKFKFLNFLMDSVLICIDRGFDLKLRAWASLLLNNHWMGLSKILWFISGE